MAAPDFPLSRIEFRHVQAFLAVHEEGHFTRAAKRLGIAQPLLSSLVARLEDLVGERLFTRRPGVQLTPAGLLFLPRARRLTEGLQDALGVVRKARRGIIGVLGAGFPSWIVASPVPVAMREFRATFPDIDVRLFSLPTSAQLAGLERGRLQVGFVRDEVVGSALYLEPLYEERWVAALPVGHPAAGQPSLAPDDLSEEPMICFPRTQAPALHDRLYGALKLCGTRLQVVHETESWFAGLGLVAAGMGLSIVPSSLMSLWSSGIVYRELHGFERSLTVSVCTHRERDRVTEAFVQVLHAACALDAKPAAPA